jgi:EmrB/QacA subfamily drug resistance transporter
MATSSPLSAAKPSWDARTWALLGVLCGVLFLDGLDVSMVGMALPSIRAELGLTTSQLQWVVSGYVLGYGGLLLLGGRAADMLGRRRVLLVALAVFAAASVVGGLVNDGTLLVVTRLLKGMAAAFTAPAGLSIITTSFAEGPQRNRALAIYTATGASGFSLGLVFGGLLTELGWRWVFLLPVPFALAILIVARRVIPKDRAMPAAARSYDIAGAVTVTAAMLLLVRTVVTAPDEGWGAPITLAGFALVAALLAAFVTIERRSAHPLIRLGILRSGPLVRANLIAMVVFGSYVGFQFIGTLYLQTMHGWSPLETALAFLPGGAIVAFGAPRIGPLVDRFGTQKLMAVGLASFVVGYALFLRLDSSPSYVLLMLPTMILIGIGFALCFPSFNIQATNGVADHEQGLASGLVNTSFQVGGAVGLAIVTAVVTSQTGTASDAAGMLDGFRPGIGVVTGVAVLGLLVAIAPGVAAVARRSAAVLAPQGR